MRKFLFLFLLPILAIAAVDPAVSAKNAQFFGIWTLVPPVVAIVLAFVTKDVILSLFIGVFSGTYLINIVDNGIFASFVKGFISIVQRIVGSMADSWNAGIIQPLVLV